MGSPSQTQLTSMSHLSAWTSCLGVPPTLGSASTSTQVPAQAAFLVPSKLLKCLPSSSIALTLQPLYPKVKLQFGGHWDVSIFHSVFAE